MKKALIAGLTALLFCSFVTSVFAGWQENRVRKGGVLYKFKAQEKITKGQEEAFTDLMYNKHKTMSLKKFQKLQINLDKVETDLTEEEFCKLLIQTGAVEFAEPDYLIPPVYIPDDPNIGSQWFHTNINSYQAWDDIRGDQAVIAAVCDTGVLSTHPDLQQNMQLPGYNSVDGTTDSEPVHYHGTAVAGCISAIGDNGIGVAGVAWNVKILPIRITNQTDGWAYISDMVDGIQYAADHGARVINLSYGGGNSYSIDSAAQYARGKGALLFMSAGNDGTDISSSYPDFNSFVLIGATTSSDTRASWSNYGTAVDIVAPGVSIYTTSSSGSYGSYSGTSFSSPISAGLGALIFSVNQSLTPTQVENIIFSTCADIGDVGEDNVYGWGRIDAAKAVAKAKTYGVNQRPVAVLSAGPVEGTVPLIVTFDGSGSYDNDGTIMAYNWDFGDGQKGTGQVCDHTYADEGQITAILTVVDDGGAEAQAAIDITVYPDPSKVDAPSALAATVNGLDVYLTWQDNSGNESGFYIERALKVKGKYSYKRIGQVGPGTTSYADSVSAGTYKYRLQAFNSTNISGYSNEVTVTVGNTTKPVKPPKK